jgi:hypothetical protein
VETWVGGGIFGGEVVSLEETGTELATRALRIVNGARPEDMAVQEAPTVPMFDWRQLRRFHVTEASLPAGSVVRFKEFTFWELYSFCKHCCWPLFCSNAPESGEPHADSLKAKRDLPRRSKPIPNQCR